MGFVIPLAEIRACLNELDSELLRLAHIECSQAPTSQLCAFLQLGIRAVSLMKAMEQSIRLRDPDGYYVLGRASWESCQLQLEFRFKDSNTKVTKWFCGESDSWNSNHRKLDQWVGGLGGAASTFRKEFGGLAQLAHPTLDAARNSVICSLAQKGDPPSVAQVETGIRDAQLDLSGRVMREFWIMDWQHPDLIDLPIERANLARCAQAFEAFRNS